MSLPPLWVVKVNFYKDKLELETLYQKLRLHYVLLQSYGFDKQKCYFMSLPFALLENLKTNLKTKLRLSERVADHNGRDNKSHLVKHAVENGHRYPDMIDFRIVGKGYRNITFKRKIAESLLIKDMRPSLNIHEKSVPLKLLD